MKPTKKKIMAAFFIFTLFGLMIGISGRQTSKPADSLESFKNYDEARAKSREELAAQVAAHEPPPLQIDENLSSAEIEARIKEIDSKIESQDLVKRANAGELSIDELSLFRRQLELRTKYFERKIDLEIDHEV